MIMSTAEETTQITIVNTNMKTDLMRLRELSGSILRVPLSHPPNNYRCSTILRINVLPLTVSL